VVTRAIYWVALTAVLNCSFAEAVEPDYGAWRKADPAGNWTREAESAVAGVGLPAMQPSDVREFCPNYDNANEIERTRFWAGLLSIMAGLESNFNPGATYEEDIYDSAGAKVVSRGLLQISQESANSKAYACGIVQAQDLHEPSVNLRCGAKIMAHWVSHDGRIAAHSEPPRGGARYWSILRGWRDHLPKIAEFTSALPGCKTDGH